MEQDFALSTFSQLSSLYGRSILTPGGSRTQSLCPPAGVLPLVIIKIHRLTFRRLNVAQLQPQMVLRTVPYMG